MDIQAIHNQLADEAALRRQTIEKASAERDTACKYLDLASTELDAIVKSMGVLADLIPQDVTMERESEKVLKRAY